MNLDRPDLMKFFMTLRRILKMTLCRPTHCHLFLTFFWSLKITLCRILKMTVCRPSIFHLFLTKRQMK
jgi:hypothetical protein